MNYYHCCHLEGLLELHQSVSRERYIHGHLDDNDFSTTYIVQVQSNICIIINCSEDLILKFILTLMTNQLSK